MKNVPPPRAGKVKCQGFDLVKRKADGEGGSPDGIGSIMVDQALLAQGIVSSTIGSEFSELS